MAGYAYYNGMFGERDSIKIPLDNRALYFGDGVYDMAIGMGGRIYQTESHIRRFLTNADRLGIRCDYNANEIGELLYETVRRSGYEEYTVYFQLSRTRVDLCKSIQYICSK